MTIQDLEKLIRPLKNRVMNMMARAIIKLADDATAQVEAHEGEIRDEVDRMQEYGFASRPLAGADALVVFIGGNRDHGVVVASSDKRGRPALEEGEAAMWTSDGVTIRIFKDKKVKIEGAASIELNGDSKQFVTHAELQSALTALCATLTAHVHPANGTPAPGLVGLSCDITAAKTTTIKTGG